MDVYGIANQYTLFTNKHIFITGKAGTGKTTFLKNLRETTSKQISVLAPTGIAAINACGVTIHSFFQLPPQLLLPTPSERKRLFAEMQMRGNKRRVIRNLELLVIDEVSMVRADLLDAIDAVLRHFRHQPNLPFGGVQVIFIGDLYQLSPVVKEDEWELMRAFYDGAYFFNARIFKEIHPIYIEFDRIFRQNAPKFIELLNEVRNNCLSDSNRELLNSRYMPNYENEDSNFHITLATHNKKVDAINSQKLEELTGKAYTFKAEIQDNFPETSYPADKELVLKEGARVMFIKNDSSLEKRYYNGKQGIITYIDGKTIEVTCENEDPIIVEPATWENIKYIADKETLEIKTEIQGQFTQYPLRLAWAITIHKAQGLTFDKVIIDAHDAFAAGQVYVALSRCKSLEGIVLKSKISAHTLTNDKSVITFTQNQVSIEDTSNMLPKAKHEYLIASITSQYDFNDDIEQAQQLHLYNVAGDLLQLQATGGKFQNQVRRIMNAETMDVKLLIERLCASYEYFSPQLIKICDEIKKAQIPIGEEDASNYANSLQDLYISLQMKLHLMKNMRNNPSIENYAECKKIYKFEIIDILNQKAKRTKKQTQANSNKELINKRKKGQSSFMTLTMFLSGKSIHQIAQDRGLAKSTIAKHLYEFINMKLISWDKFSPEDKIEMAKALGRR